MKLWLDVHLSPAIASWLSATYQIEAACIRDLGMRTAEDEDIFAAAREAGACVMTKDRVRISVIVNPDR